MDRCLPMMLHHHRLQLCLLPIFRHLQVTIHQILYNICDNAIKFSPENDEIEIAVIRGENSFKLAVHDNGIGIDPKYHGKIFGKFFQLENIYTKTGGVIIFDGPVTKIGLNSFRECTTLKQITIPDTVTIIGASAFNGCSGLTSITVDANNTYFDSRNNCNAIIRTSTNNLRVGCENTVIPSSVTTIGDYSFYGRNVSNGITIPSSVTTIGVSSFQKVTGIT